MDSADLESATERWLRQLPAPHAPQTLLPRVLASVQAWSRQPWYTRAWVTWPVAWQAASISVFLLLSGIAAFWLQGAQVSVLPGAWSELPGSITAAVRRAGAAAGAAHIVWRTVFEPLIACVFPLAALMWLACVGLGALLTRVVPREALHR